MDIGVDQGQPQNNLQGYFSRNLPVSKEEDLLRSHDGRYYYSSFLYDKPFPSYQLPIDKFTRDINQYRSKRNYRMHEQMLEKLNDLYTSSNDILDNMNTDDIKTSFYNFMEDLVNRCPSLDVFMVGNRLFYTGIILLVVAVLLMI
jgi:hypothetical protein